MRFIKILVVALAFYSSLAFAMPAQVLLIRHAEKPRKGHELSETGWLRARALPKLFHDRAEFSIYGPPAALYAMAPGEVGKSLRAIQTLQFTAEDFHLPILTDFSRDEIAAVAARIRGDRSLDGRMVVICWQHTALVEIARELGGKNLPKWPKKQYDRVWSLKFAADGRVGEFQSLPQRLLPHDHRD